MAVQKLLEDVKVPPIVLGVFVAILTLGYFAGVTVTRMQAADELNKVQSEHSLKMHEHSLEMQKLRHEFALDEVEGLRADVYREDKHLRDDIEEIKSEVKDSRK